MIDADTTGCGAIRLAHLSGGQGVGGSNPLILTIRENNMNGSPTTPLKSDWIKSPYVAKKKIRELVREWKPILDLGHWTIDVSFDKKQWAACCEAKPEYRAANINFYMAKLLPKLKLNYELEEFVVHELIHCLTWPTVGIAERLIEVIGDPTGELWKRKEDEEELCVQRLSDALVMAKYNMKSIPNTVRVQGLEKRRERKH